MTINIVDNNALSWWLFCPKCVV